MEIIKRWLVDDVGISLEGSADQVEREFANGYNFAQVMRKYNLQPDFDKFANKQNPEVKLANFQRLQPTFRALNIRFDSHIANQLMTEEPGVAAALLGQLKVALDMPAGSKTRLSTGRSQKQGSTSLLLTTNRLASKEKYKDMQELTFDKTLRLKTADPKEYRMSNQLRAFEEEAVRQQYVAEMGDAQAKLNHEMHLADHRDTMLTKSKENRAYLDDWERQGRVNHAKNQAAKKERERKDLRVELAMKEKAERKQAMESETAAGEMVNGIDAFEDSLRRIQDQAEGDVPEELLSKTSQETPEQFLASLTAKVPVGAVLKKESELYMKKVRERREEEELARKERGRRRRRVLVEQMRTHKDMEARRREKMLMDKITRQSSEEQRIAQRLHAALQEKEVMRQARLRREQQYIQQRQMQLDEVRAADAKKYALMREDYLAAVASDRARLEENERMVRAAKSQKHYDICRGIVDQVVDLTAKTCQYRSVTDSALVSVKQWREWMTLFTAGIPLYPPEPQVVKSEEGLTLPPEEDIQAKLIDACDYNDYLELASDWKLPDEPAPDPEADGGKEEGDAEQQTDAEAVGSPKRTPESVGGTPPVVVGNPLLGAAVREIRRLLDKEQDPPVKPQGLPEAPLALFVHGGPFTGVSRQCARLAEEKDLEIIKVDVLVRDAVKQFEDVMTEYDAAVEEAKQAAGDAGVVEPVPEPELTDEAIVGGKARELLAEGLPVADDLLVALVVLKIRSLESGRGYVCDGFPATVMQARLLEKELGGIEDRHTAPPLLPPSSLLAPTPAEEERIEKKLPSGVDLYIRLQGDAEVQRRRALGRMVDPENPDGPCYHLEFDKPPEDDPALAARLVPVDDVLATDALLMERMLAYHEESLALDIWFNKFDNVLNVPSDGTVDEVLQVIVGELDARREAKEAAAAALVAAQEAEEARIAAEAEAAAAAASAQEQAAAEKGEGGEEEGEGEAGEAAAADTSLAEAQEEEAFVESARLHKDMARLLLEQWTDCEATFEHEVCTIMRSLRGEVKDVINQVAQARTAFMNYLQQPDGKQKLLHAFQIEYNAVDKELRVLDQTKVHLHCLADDLRDALWAQCDEVRDAAEQERNAVAQDSYIDDHISTIGMMFASLVEQEVLRFHSTANILRDYHYSKAGKELEIELPEPMQALQAYMDACEEGGGDAEEGSLLKGSDLKIISALKKVIEDAVAQLCVTPPEEEVAEEEGEEKTGDAAVEGLQPSLRVEEELLRKRLSAIQARVEAMVTDLRAREAKLLQKMDDMLGDRFRGEVEAISALILTIKTAIEKGERLYHELRLQQSDFLKNEDSLTYVLYEPPPPPPPREMLPSFHLTTYQLAHLIPMFKAAAPTNIIAVDAAVRTLQQAGAMGGVKVLPVEWVQLLPSQLLSFVKLYDRGGCGLVDWRRIAYSLFALPQPTLAQLRAIITALAGLEPPLPLSNNIPYDVAKSLPLWFASSQEPRVEIGDDGVPLVRSRRVNALKNLVLEAFTSDQKVAMEHLLLYACAAPTLVASMRTAANVIGDKDSTVSGAELLRIVTLATLPLSAEAGFDRQSAISGAMHQVMTSEAIPAASNDEEGEEEQVDAPVANEEETYTVDENMRVSVDRLIKAERGRVLVSRCHGLELIDAYTVVAKIALPPAPASVSSMLEEAAE